MKKTYLIVILLFTLLSLYSQEEHKEEKNLKVAGIPIISYDRTVEFTGGAILTGYYKMNQKDTVSPSSSTSIVGVYTSNNSYFAAAIQQFYLKQDTWRIKTIAGLGNANLQVYIDMVNPGRFIDYQTFINLVLLDVKRKVFEDFYFGLSGALVYAETTFDIGIPGMKTYVDKQTMNNMGFSLLYDTRDNVNYPGNGFQGSVNNQFYQEWMGNDSSFTKIEVTWDHYLNLKEDQQVLLLRYFSKMSFGDVPFQGQNVVRGDDIRGYSKGKYRGNHMYTLQSEYRYKFKDNKFGFVAFAGVAAAVPDFSGLFNTTYLPGAGVGIRYRLIEKEKINIGIDVGIGKDDWSLTFRVGDAFSR